MATSISTSYAGQFAGKYIAASLLSADTIEGNGITVKPNIKFRETLKVLSTNALVKNASCDYSDQSQVTLSERVLSPEEYEVNLTLCRKDFRSDWESVEMGYSAYDQLPPSFADFLIGHVSAKVAEKMETNIWGGVTANAGEFDGLTVLMLADSAVVDATTTETAFAAGTIQAELAKMVDAIPSAVYGAEDLAIYVPKKVAQLYIRSLNGFGASGVGANGVEGQGSMWYGMGGQLSYEGIPLFVAPGMPADHMVAARRENLYFGTGLLSDHNEVRVIDTAESLGDQNVRIVMRFTAAVNYGVSSECVLYTLAS